MVEEAVVDLDVGVASVRAIPPASVSQQHSHDGDSGSSHGEGGNSGSGGRATVAWCSAWWSSRRRGSPVRSTGEP